MTKSGIFYLVLRLILGGVMIYGGVEKFSGNSYTPTELVEKASKFMDLQKENTLKKILYVGGLKQTGYFWQVLGVCELTFGILILIPLSSILGALLLLPISFQIFLFHLFLEFDEPLEILIAFGLLAINIALVLRENRWHLLLFLSRDTQKAN